MLKKEELEAGKIVDLINKILLSTMVTVIAFVIL